MIVTAANITTFANASVNTATDLNTTITEIVDTINAALETATGHNHDGTNSRSVSSTVAGLTIAEYAVAQIMGWFD